jgi:hypothetical protein
MDNTTRSSRFSLTTVIALLALFVGLSGTAYAAATIGTSDLKNQAVTTPKLADGAVTAKKISTQAVGPAKIALGAIRTAKIFDAAVTTAKLADGSVNTAKLADNSVTTSKIADGNVLNADLGNNSVTSGKIADGNVINADLGNNAVTSGKIADGQVRAQDIGPITRTSNSASVANGATGTVTATCPAGRRVMFAGWVLSGAGGLARVSSDTGNAAGTNWTVTVRNESGATRNLFVDVYCIQAA